MEDTVAMPLQDSGSWEKSAAYAGFYLSCQLRTKASYVRRNFTEVCPSWCYSNQDGYLSKEDVDLYPCLRRFPRPSRIWTWTRPKARRRLGLLRSTSRAKKNSSRRAKKPTAKAASPAAPSELQGIWAEQTD
eukprot:s1665_g2.t1